MRTLAAASVATAGGLATLWGCGHCHAWQARNDTVLAAAASVPRAGGETDRADNTATPPTSPGQTESLREACTGAAEVVDATASVVTEQIDIDEDPHALDGVATPQRCRAPLPGAGWTRPEWAGEKEKQGKSALAPEPPGVVFDNDETGQTEPRKPEENPKDRVPESARARADNVAGKQTVDHTPAVKNQAAEQRSLSGHTAGDSRSPNGDAPETELSQEEQPTTLAENEENRILEPKDDRGDGLSDSSAAPTDSAPPRPPQMGHVATCRQLFEEDAVASAAGLRMCEPEMDEKTRRSASLAIKFTQLRDDLTSIEADAVAGRCDGWVQEQPDIKFGSSPGQELATVPEHAVATLGVACGRCSSTSSSDSDTEYTECIDDGRPHGTPTLVPWHPIEEAPPSHRLCGNAPVAPFVHRPNTSAFKQFG